MAPNTKSSRGPKYVLLSDLPDVSSPNLKVDPETDFINIRGLPSLAITGTVAYANTNDKGKRTIAIQVDKDIGDKFEQYLDASLSPLCTIKSTEEKKGNKRTRVDQAEVSFPIASDSYDHQKSIIYVTPHKNSKFLRISEDNKATPSTFDVIEAGNKVQANGFIGGSLYEGKYYFRVQGAIVMTQVTGNEKKEGETEEQEETAPSFFGMTIA